MESPPPHTTPGLSLRQIARLCRDIYGIAETEQALAEVLDLSEADVAEVMRSLNANNN